MIGNISIPVPAKKLTPRELEVLTLTAYGKTRADISKILSLTEGTVKEYIARICAKLKASNKTHAATIALALGLITPYREAVQGEMSSPTSVVPQTATAHGCKCSVLKRRDTSKIARDRRRSEMLPDDRKKK